MDRTITAYGWKGSLDCGIAERELRCLLAIAAGETDKQAAQSAGISPRTVKGAVERVMHKLHTYKRTALVAEAFRRGIIAPAICMVLALLIGLQQNPNAIRRPACPRRVETFNSVRRIEAAWVA
ncbi:response regulator transcription factor [Metapseudomonas otitidis]|uniref:response regulator transcription factor n=1 Tax=Metapseudomonas otitidis TaxID=319939 RepID=UPI001F1F9007|nr:LuxR C-terminal-related transcriptional regulator [Pseudomonas otitidis]